MSLLCPLRPFQFSQKNKMKIEIENFLFKPAISYLISRLDSDRWGRPSARRSATVGRTRRFINKNGGENLRLFYSDKFSWKHRLGDVYMSVFRVSLCGMVRFWKLFYGLGPFHRWSKWKTILIIQNIFLSKHTNFHKSFNWEPFHTHGLFTCAFWE
jgi:hypothetical protein